MSVLQETIAGKETATGKKRILIVDDEAGFLLALKRILQGPELVVDTAETIETAMALLNENAYQVVIADVMLTIMLREEGLEILEYVKEHMPGTKVIILTGYGNQDLMKKAGTLRADLFFEKPVPPHILQNTLKCWGVAC
ncbi:MAG TPA: hypothetical protein DCO77_13650 [Nitrospiraceae bacterium]|nr:hypothetical protein [Nitrospiraceae bacterium]